MGKIEEVGGVEPYLDATKDLHNGIGYKPMFAMLTAKDPDGKPMDRSLIAKIAGISRYTLHMTYIPLIESKTGLKLSNETTKE
jgi:hypothetical protein